MLQTLAKIGEQLLEGKGIWARLTTEPKYDPEKKNWICPILFDCVNQEIRVLKDEMGNNRTLPGLKFGISLFKA